MNDEDELKLIGKAFHLVDELSNIQEQLRAQYTLRVNAIDVRTHADSHEINSFRLTVSKTIERRT